LTYVGEAISEGANVSAIVDAENGCGREIVGVTAEEENAQESGVLEFFLERENVDRMMAVVVAMNGNPPSCS
jgi:hypothetical protein